MLLYECLLVQCIETGLCNTLVCIVIRGYSIDSPCITMYNGVG